MTKDLSLDDLLIAHAAGKLAEPVALVVATHLALSPDQPPPLCALRGGGRVAARGPSPRRIWPRMPGSG